MLTVLAPASGTMSSRHQQSNGSTRCDSSTYGGSSSSTSPIQLATTISASNVSTGSASTVNDGCRWRPDATRRVVPSSGTVSSARGRHRRRARPRGAGAGVLSADQRGVGGGVDRLHRAASPPWSGWARLASRRRARCTSSAVDVGSMPSSSNGSCSIEPALKPVAGDELVAQRRIPRPHPDRVGGSVGLDRLRPAQPPRSAIDACGSPLRVAAACTHARRPRLRRRGHEHRPVAQPGEHRRTAADGRRRRSARCDPRRSAPRARRARRAGRTPRRRRRPGRAARGDVGAQPAEDAGGVRAVRGAFAVEVRQQRECTRRSPAIASRSNST